MLPSVGPGVVARVDVEAARMSVASWRRRGSVVGAGAGGARVAGILRGR